MPLGLENLQNISIPFSYSGMTTDIDVKSIPEGYCLWNENLCIDVSGRGVKRYGCEKVSTCGLATGNKKRFECLKIWDAPFNNDELIIYGKYFNLDNVYVSEGPSLMSGKLTLNISAENLEKFKSLYLKKSEICINYETGGIQYEHYCHIDELNFSEPQDSKITVTLKFSPEIPLKIGQQVIFKNLWHLRGMICRYNFEKQEWAILKEGLEGVCIPRAVVFNNTLIITNGVDNLLKVFESEEVTKIEELSDWFLQQRVASTSITKEGNKKISFFVSTKEDAKEWESKFKKFRLDEYLSVLYTVIDGTYTEVDTGKFKVTVTTEQNIEGENFNKIYIVRNPPRCNFLFVFNRYIYGLGQGRASQEYREKAEALKVYRTSLPGVDNRWTDEKTHDYVSFDFSLNHGVGDNFEAIACLGTNLLFFGRKRTQVWRTGDALNIGSLTNKFSDTFGRFVTFLDIGILHGNLVWEIANDIYYIDSNGIHSINTINLGNQPAVSTVSLINKEIQSNAELLVREPGKYYKYDVYKNSFGSFVLINLANSYSYYASYSHVINYYGVFSGLVDAGSVYCTHHDNMFFMRGAILYRYTDGANGKGYGYSDDGNKVVARWRLPFLNKVELGWLTTHIRMDVLHSNDFLKKEGNTCTVSIINTDSQVNIKMEAEEQYDELTGDASYPFEFRKEYSLKSHPVKIYGESSILECNISSDSFFGIRKINLYGRYDGRITY